MLYKKIDLELIVPADEADAVVAELAAALDHIKERYTFFGGGTKTVPIARTGSRRKSALSHALNADKTAVGAIKTVRERATSALHLINESLSVEQCQLFRTAFDAGIHRRWWWSCCVRLGMFRANGHHTRTAGADGYLCPPHSGNSSRPRCVCVVSSQERGRIGEPGLRADCRTGDHVPRIRC